MFTMKPEGGSNSRDAASWSLCEVYQTAGGRKSCWVSDEFQKQDEGVGEHCGRFTAPPAGNSASHRTSRVVCSQTQGPFAAGVVESQTKPSLKPPD